MPSAEKSFFTELTLSSFTSFEYNGRQEEEKVTLYKQVSCFSQTKDLQFPDWDTTDPDYETNVIKYTKPL